MNKNIIPINLNQKVPGCNNFYWYELVYLSGLDSYIYTSKEVKENLIDICKRLQKIRDMFGKSIKITSGYRPALYNKHINGAAKSQHVLGKAIDFKVKGVSADRVRKKILPELEKLGLRMEDLPKSTWVHIDTKKVGRKRFFQP
jgi:uncharacterized protein YcbK (DUF882 family)